MTSIGRNETITVGQWLRQEPFSLTLSAGFFGFFAHAGCVSALEANELWPQAISGSSAGALVGALWSSGLDRTDIRSALVDLRKTDFWDPGLGLGLLKGERFSEKLDALLFASTFETCRWPLAVSVFDLKTLRTHVLSAGHLNPAVRASCAYPGLFHPVSVNGLWAIDGGVLDRSGLAAFSPGTRIVYHHLPSRSRWRRRIKRLSGIPQQDNLLTIVPHGLPKLGPSRMTDGLLAYDTAREHTLRMLDRPFRSVS